MSALDLLDLAGSMIFSGRRCREAGDLAAAAAIFAGARELIAQARARK